MLQSILNQKGVKGLKKAQQEAINGGGNLNDFCHTDRECCYPLICAGCFCRPLGGPF